MPNSMHIKKKSSDSFLLLLSLVLYYFYPLAHADSSKINEFKNYIHTIWNPTMYIWWEIRNFSVTFVNSDSIEGMKWCKLYKISIFFNILTGQPVSTIFSTVQNLSHLYPASLWEWCNMNYSSKYKCHVTDY